MRLKSLSRIRALSFEHTLEKKIMQKTEWQSLGFPAIKYLEQLPYREIFVLNSHLKDFLRFSTSAL